MIQIAIPALVAFGAGWLASDFKKKKQSSSSAKVGDTITAKVEGLIYQARVLQNLPDRYDAQITIAPPAVGAWQPGQRVQIAKSSVVQINGK